MSGTDKLKLAEKKKSATDEGMIATIAKAAEAMTPPDKRRLEVSGAGKRILSLRNKQMKTPLKDEKPMRSGSKTLSSFLALPIELHLQIILNLAHSVESGLLALREVNRYLRSIIFPADFHTWGTTLLEDRQFKAADRLYCFLRIEDRLPCTLCQRLLPKEQFHMHAKQGKKALGHKLGHKRFCMDCGLKHRKFGGGNSVKVDDQSDHYKVICPVCLEFLNEPEGFAGCPEHFLLADSEKQCLKLLRLRGSGPSN